MRIDEYQRIYESKHDDELLLLAESSAELTDEARAALQSELSRRAMTAELLAGPTPVPTAQYPATSKPSEFGFTSVGEFLNEVMSTYRSHFWLFVGLVAPAIVFGYYGREFSRVFSRHLLHQFLTHADGLTPDKVRFEAATIGGIINFLTWTCFGVCYAGTASAVSLIKEGGTPSFGSCFDELLRRPGRFLGISTVLCVLFVAATACLSFVYLWLIRIFGLDFRGSTVQMLVYVLYFPMVLVLSRFALAIPAVTLGDCTLQHSIFRSDEMTEGKWVVLAALLIKSIVGGYVAGMLPFWIAQWMWPYVHFYGWILTAASIVGVILVEPILFIGFSLLYLDGKQTVQHSGGAIAIHA